MTDEREEGWDARRGNYLRDVAVKTSWAFDGACGRDDHVLGENVF
jgi:hypothetical protein